MLKTFSNFLSHLKKLINYSIITQIAIITMAFMEGGNSVTEHSSNSWEKEEPEMMTVVEVERMTEALKVLGLSDADILSVQKHIATGADLPVKDTSEKRS